MRLPRASLTARQAMVLEGLRAQGVMRSGRDGAVLRALAVKGYTLAHPFSEGQNTYYTWTLTDDGRWLARELARARIAACTEVPRVCRACHTAMAFDAPMSYGVCLECDSTMSRGAQD